MYCMYSIKRIVKNTVFYNNIRIFENPMANIIIVMRKISSLLALLIMFSSCPVEGLLIAGVKKHSVRVDGRGRW